MTIPIVQLLLGLIFLYLGAEWLVRSSASMALKWGISPLVIGITIIGYGTSFPELVVNLEATFEHHPALAMGNIVGSNLLNSSFILGMALLIYPAKTTFVSRYFDGPFMLLSCLILAWIVYMGHLGIAIGAILFSALICYTFLSLYFSKRESSIKEASQQIDIPIWDIQKALPLLPISLGVLILGSNIFLRGAISISEYFGMSDAMIGLTFVALGTSLPELATSILAAYRKHTSIALGNILGSNVYNVLGVSGLIGVIKPFSFSGISNVDVVAMILINILLATFLLFSKKLGRVMGGVFTIFYIGYFSYLMTTF